MHFVSATTLLLPTLLLAAPLENRQDEPCAPTSYTISNFSYKDGSAGASVDFAFQSTFPNPSIIEDQASNGATCSANGADGTIPNSNECSIGRNLLFDLRAPQEQAEYQLTHTWRCNGQTWMSSTPHKIAPLNCNTSGGTTECTSEPQTFAPQNVRRICSTPTCP